MLSPVNLDNSSAIRCASRFLMFSPIFYLSTHNHEPFYHGIIIRQEEGREPYPTLRFRRPLGRIAGCIARDAPVIQLKLQPQHYSHHFRGRPMKKVSEHRANHEFSELLSRMERGEEILITKRSKPVALLAPYRPPRLTPERQAAINHAIGVMTQGLPTGARPSQVSGAMKCTRALQTSSPRSRAYPFCSLRECVDTCCMQDTS